RQDHTVDGDTIAGADSLERFRYALVRQQVAAVRHDDVRAVAAGAPGAECARAEAEQFLALLTHGAFTAADPRVGHHLVAYCHTRGLRAEGCDLARDLVPHREGQVHAA